MKNNNIMSSITNLITIIDEFSDNTVGEMRENIYFTKILMSELEILDDLIETTLKDKKKINKEEIKNINIGFDKLKYNVILLFTIFKKNHINITINLNKINIKIKDRTYCVIVMYETGLKGLTKNLASEIKKLQDKRNKMMNMLKIEYVLGVFIRKYSKYNKLIVLN